MSMTNCCVDFPCTILVTAFLFFVGMAALALTLNYFQYDYTNRRDFLIWDDAKVKDWDMQEAAKNTILQGYS